MQNNHGGQSPQNANQPYADSFSNNMGNGQPVQGYYSVQGQSYPNGYVNYAPVAPEMTNGQPSYPQQGYAQPIYSQEYAQKPYAQPMGSQQPYVPQEYMQQPYAQPMGSQQPVYPQEPAPQNYIPTYYPQGFAYPNFQNNSTPADGAGMNAVDSFGNPIQSAQTQQPVQPKESPFKQLFSKLFHKKEEPKEPQVSKESEEPAQPAEPRRKRQFRMPSIKVIFRLLLLLLLLGAVVFVVLRFGFGIGKKTSAQVEVGVFESTHTGEALIVRNETVYSDESVQDIDYIAEEGAAVNRGNVICYVYSTNYTTKEANSLQSYRDAIRDYENTLLSKETSYDADMSHLETQLLETALQIRQLIQGSKGNLLNQEEKIAQEITERQDQFKKKYPSDLTLIRNFDNETTQQQKIDSWIQSKTAMQDGIVSFYTDGFEDELSPTLYVTYTPTEVRQMLRGEHLNTTAASRGRTDLYRVVQQGNFAVLMLMHDTDFEPRKDITYKLLLEQYSEKQLDVQIIDYTRSGGDLLLRLAVMGDVRDVLYLRSCKASLSEYTNCFIVPQNALLKKDDIIGVVKLVDNQQWYIPVDVLHKKNGKAYIEPIQTGILDGNSIIKLN